MEKFTQEEIAEAQAALDLYPDACPFWDASAGQDVLYVAKRAGLESTNTNRERCRLYAERNAAAASVTTHGSCQQAFLCGWQSVSVFLRWSA